MSLIGTLTSGVSAMRSFTKGLEVIGNNISNVNTTGYKSTQASFADTFSNTLRGSAPNSGTGTSNISAVQVGTGVQLSEISSRFTQGALQSTGVGTDLGLSGSGFFLVTSPVDSSLYATRAGEFRVDDQGFMVNNKGYRVQGLVGGTAAAPVSDTTSVVGNIRLNTHKIPGDTTSSPLKSFSIDRQGNVVETYNDGTSAATNRIVLQDFRDPSALMKEGDNLYTGFDAAGVRNTITVGATLTAGQGVAGAGGLGTVEAGTLELSNVDLTEEFANMITVQRSFQASSRLVTVSDSVLEDIVNLKR